MDTCFQCGGKLKLMAKPGRMALGVDVEDDDNHDELYEIPAELKVSTCRDCGWMFEEEVWLKIQRSVEAQRKVSPGFRVDLLRFIDKRIDAMINRPGMYGDQEVVLMSVVASLHIRDAVVCKCKVDHSRDLMVELRRFLKIRFPKTYENDLLPKFCELDLNNEFAPMLGEFCDVWINTV